MGLLPRIIKEIKPKTRIADYITKEEALTYLNLIYYTFIRSTIKPGETAAHKSEFRQKGELYYNY